MQQVKKLKDQKGGKSSQIKLKKGRGWFGDTAGHSEAATMWWTYRKFMME